MLLILCAALKTESLFSLVLVGVCYAYDVQRKRYDQENNNFQWDWKSDKVYYLNEDQRKRMNSDAIYYSSTRRWELLGPLGQNVLFNEDGIVFSTLFARSFQYPCRHAFLAQFPL